MPYFQETELPKESSTSSKDSADVSQDEVDNPVMKSVDVATVNVKSGGSSPRLAIENGNSSPVSPEVLKSIDKSPKNPNGIPSSSSPSLVKPISSPTVENDFKTIKMANPTNLLNQLQNSNPFL